ncbi:MAG: DNA translocase FtsK 4TM domain-containing protein [Lachnospiraceae bacterium]|nr:DNA translocase FtsK 4TM domain-containing protein [Lachnospiraceae bacterium]
MVILSFAAAVLLFLSNFHLCGVVGDFFRSLQLGLFGMVGFAAPLLLFVGTCFYLSNRGNMTAVRKMVASLAAFLVLCGFAQLLFGKDPGAEAGILGYYKLSSQNGLGGGLVGGLVCMSLKNALGTIGAFLVLLVCLIISAVCITERSFVSAVKKGGDVAYQHAKEDMDRRRERSEERRRLREEQRVRGVNLGSTDLSTEEPYEEAYEGEEYDEEYDGAAYPDIPVNQQAEETAAMQNPAAGLEIPAMQEPAAEPLRADVFTGNISLPPEYPEDEDDTVPFDVDDGPVPTESAQSLVRTGLMGEEPEIDVPAPLVPTQAESMPEPTPEPAFKAEPVNPEPEAPILSASAGTVSIQSEFSIPEEAKRVVTAGGKIIETDTEMLQKKLESKKKEVQAAKEAGETSVLQEIKAKEEAPKKEYIFPPVSLLKRGSRIAGNHSEKEYKETAIKLQQTLRNFGVGVTVTNISCGPSVTRYELHPEQGVKVSKIVGLSDDIKLSLAAEDIRIEAPIPGKSAVGIEVPNKENNMVYLRDLLEAENFKSHPSRLAFAVGKDIGGQVVVTDIAKMPHLLIAGATGSGKSVCINTLIMSIIYKSSPEDVKLIMVDPKVVELSVYNGIPHLLIPVVTDPKKASGALNWAVAEMTDRYKKFAQYNVRDLKGYNAKVETIQDIDDENKPKKMPQIVIIVDELADLMMVAPGEVEDAICRLAQLARAAGIHLVIATQRPSVNVITGLIKANVPSRIAFSVSSGVDSRTIIDMNGAEKLLGKGDMLFYPAGFPKPQRVQGAFVSDQEVQKVVDFLTEQGMTTDYNPDVEVSINTAPAAAAAGGGNGRDEYFEQAGKFIIEKEKASIGMLQRVFKIGFNRAARIMDQLSEAGVVGEEEGTKPRKVLMTMEDFEEMVQRGE